ncbi:extensin-like [Myripristis murdjan]|uniref:extensin-like n=1 Tax=Myripristis murdjan TaxID=586833 RepID=UPI001175D9A9|nr:extensin-like [Myripristis murdjan]
MQVSHQVTSSTPLQIPPQPELATLRNRHPILLDSIQPVLAQNIINTNRGMEGPVQPQAPRTSRSCSSSGLGKCWSLDVRVAVLLVTLAGAVILLLLYRLLQLRHRLKLARARHALEYYSFYHAAAYTLKDPGLPEVLPAKTGNGSEVTPPVQTATPVTPTTNTLLPPPPVSPPPPLPLPPPPVLPPPPALPPPPLVRPPPLPPTPSLISLPLPLPVIHTTPPSPHLSWGASSDADVYSRIGAFRPSRLSSLSSQTQVILFEHSSL